MIEIRSNDQAFSDLNYFNQAITYLDNLIEHKESNDHKLKIPMGSLIDKSIAFHYHHLNLVEAQLTCLNEIISN